MSVLGAVIVLGAEDQTKTSSWIWPEGAEILWGTPAFLIVAYLLWKFGWPPIKKAMQDRTARIAQQLDEAATAKADADQAAVDIRQAKGDIATERARLLAAADEQAAQLLTDGRARLEHEMADLLAKSEADLASSQGRVMAEVQEEVANLASAAAERIVVEALADENLRRDLVEQFIATVGATGAAEVTHR